MLGQRSEPETGVWVAGLDDVTAEALALPWRYCTPPPIICYLAAGVAQRDDEHPLVDVRALRTDHLERVCERGVRLR